MELRNWGNENYGKVGEKAPFRDTNGDNLYIGDLVVIQYKDEEMEEERKTGRTSGRSEDCRTSNTQGTYDGRVGGRLY